MDDDEELDNLGNYSKEHEFFDQVIGHIENIILSDNFKLLHDNFLREHCVHFDNNEENKFEYMDIYLKYTKIFETFFVNKLLELMPTFNMNKFNEELRNCTDIQSVLDFQDSEVYDLLHSFQNFQTFKELMLDYRKEHDGRDQHLELNFLVVKPYHLTNHTQLENSDK